MKGLKRYTKSTLTYGESFEINKRRKEEEARKKLLENNCSHDDGFDVSLGAMVGALMADDSASMPDTSQIDYSRDTSNYDTYTSCDTSIDCDISGSFD